MMNKNSTVEYQTVLQQAFWRLGVNLQPRVPTKAVCFEQLQLRNEIVTFMNLRSQIHRWEMQNEAANGSSFHDGSHRETTGTSKRLHCEEDLDWIPGKTDSGGARTSKKDRKSKASGQCKKASSTAQSKRKR
ncbi:SWR1-complex protein 4-like [Vicia villosa]|uniref:SWR1-complex protein 4-like n=1 Tax=Vicia villosa TaxID=3911 RepID=UPI00273CA297|nr:SWR1-complex protein 4-like [Vicia villosa]